MKSPTLFGIVAVATLAMFVAETQAGPRGGGGRRGGGGADLGGSRLSGGSRPSPNISPGGNLGGNIGSGNFNAGSRDLSGRAGGDLSDRLNSGGGNLSNLRPQGQDKLSNLLEGKSFQPGSGNFQRGDAVSQDKLQNFLGLSDGTREPSGNHQQQIQDKKNELQPKIDQTKQNVSDRSNEIYNNVNQHLANQPEPFSPQWYAAHPNAFHYQYPHADAWAAASWGAVTGWVVGMSTTPVSYTYNNNTVVYSTDTTAATPVNAEATQQLSQPGPAPSDEEWMPLGVYALVEGNQTQAQMLMQLAVSKSGQIGGSYYNVLSDNSQPLTGSVNKQTQEVAWHVAKNDKVVFQTDVKSLTEAETPVVVHYGDGTTHPMTLVRMPNKQ
ncbi:hypothetical protein [Bremerella cremea]|uniref:hypothetical protein n=1 Tax=Bremerella cremea TaxID=1031537 RepID=UPI0031EE8309